MEDKVELKQEHWNSIKDEFLKNIPEKYSFELVGFRENTEYYHPTIQLEDGLRIRSQCSLGHENVYAIHLEKTLNLSPNIYTVTVYFEDYSTLNDFLENYESRVEIAKKYLIQQESLIKIKNKIEKSMTNLTHISYLEDVDKLKDSKIKKELKKDIEDIIIGLEENRIL